MNSNVGGASVSSLSGVSLNGGNFTSGWSNSFKSNGGSSNKNTVAKLETVSVSFHTFEGRDIYTKKAGKPPGPASAIKIVSEIAKDPAKNIAKDFSAMGLKALEKTRLAFSVPVLGIAATYGTTVLTELIGYGVEGKTIDWTKINAKAAGKATGGLINLVGSLVSFKKDVNGKLVWREKSLDKFISGLIFDEKGITKALWSDMSSNPAWNPLTRVGINPEKLGFKDIITLAKNKEARQLLITARKELYSNVLQDMVKGGALDVAKNVGLQMAAAVGFDYVFTLAGTFVGNLINGQSIGYALHIDNMHYGQEALKSVNKIVWTYAGKFIGMALGNAKVGQIVGALIGSIINNWICEPFRRPDGTIDEGACAIAAGAELAGAVAGAILAACLCSGPIGWVLGLGILVGAVVGYLATVIVYNWNNICNWVSDKIEKIAEGFRIAGQAISIAAVAVGDFFKNNWNAAVEKVNTAVVVAGAFLGQLWEDVKGAVVYHVTSAAVAVGDFFVDLGDGIVWLWNEFTAWVAGVFA